MRVSFGTSTNIGRRPSQQDEYLVQEDVFEGSPAASLFGVFDGHGSEGGKASTFTRQIFPEVLRRHKDEFLDDPVEALKAVFRDVNTQLAENDAIDTYMSGTTAVVLICLEADDRVVIANVGDSRVLLGRKEGDDDAWAAVQLTTDHTCSNPDELSRVKSSGARIEQLTIGEDKDGPLRIFKGTLPYPGLVVTRSLGDAVAGRLGVLCEPEVIDMKVNPKRDRFFILGTDGLWDGLDIDVAVSIAAKYKDPMKASSVLTKRALEGLDKKQIDDNVTNVVIYVNRK
ncbi:phosphatase 2C-like domain-containing protein [Zopfochytrium polystomum]|nr:phosphatase 2C-like domain-containing protein [Zopfochytrium polystomum]